MRWLYLVLTLSFPAFLASCSVAAPASIVDVEQKLINKEFSQAEELLKPLVEAGGEGEDYARFLLGESLFEQGNFQEAREAYEDVVTKFPKSPWNQKSFYRSADCLTRLKQFDKGGDALQPKIEALVSEGRKEEVAGTYLKYADRYFAPNEKDEKPNYARARTLYQKALELGLTQKTANRVQLLMARCDFETGSFSAAVQGLEKLLKDSPESDQAPEARYLLGRSYLGLDNGSKARRVFRDFLEDYPQSDLRAKVAFGIALSYHLPNPRNDSDLELGVKALRDFYESFSKSEDAVKADYWIGLSYYNRGRYDEAWREFTRFLKRHDGGEAEYLAPAQQRLGEIALLQRRYQAAIENWREFLKAYPNHSLWPSVQRRVLDTEYFIGQEALDNKRYDEAAAVWRKFQEQYPLDQRNPDIMFMLGQMEHDQKRYEAAVEKWQQLTSKYEGTEAAARGWLMIGVTQEEKLGDFDTAAVSYAKVTSGQWAAEATQRVQAMKEKKLIVYTERTFTTADKPVLKLLTRNLDKIEFRGYRVNLGDYFRKLHTIRGVEGLDLALIDADQKWEFAVPDYKEKKQMEIEAPLPFTEPGVYAVVCAAGTLEATTVVMITDLQIITKATRRDVLVFAENFREQKSWAEAQVVLSDGTKILATGVTDSQGVFQREVEGLKDVSQLRVLAFSDTHYASTENALQGLRYVAGLAPKALIYSDRPLYRPGQEVHLRGIVRKVSRGEYVFEKDDSFDLQVLNPAGVAILKRSVRLDDFGAFAQSLKLPQEAQPGNYRVVVTQDKLTFTGGFEVGEYQLPKIRMEISIPRTTYLRGEKVEGKVSVKYYYGEPLAKRKVMFAWGDEPEKEITTNEKGEFEFSLDTKRFEEEAVFPVKARLPEEGISAAVNVYVAPVELRATVTTLREVYLVGEKFEVFATATDLSEKPAKGKFALHVLKREKTGELWGEREVDNKPLSTDGKEGKGSATISLDHGGSYVLRLKGEDRHDNPVTAERYVTIVGEDDKVKLRILTDSDTFKVGDTAEVRVVSRMTRNLALVTYEGEVIYGHQIVALDKGDNTVSVPMTAKLSPGFALSVSMMTAPEDDQKSNEFHAAAKLFKVKGNLQVVVKPDKEKYQPGDEVRLRVSAADAQGKPARAELSLAAVDASLFAVRADTTPALANYFYERPITTGSVLTQTSCIFNYTAQARQTAIQVREALDVSSRLRRPPSATPHGPQGAAGPAGPQGPSGKAQISGSLLGRAGVGAQIDGVGEEAAVEAAKSDRDRKAMPGAPPPPLREFFAETAFWKADIVTDRDGAATVSFKLPDTITEWRLTARGVTVETLAGDTSTKVTTQKDFIAELKLPEIFQQSDTMEVTVVAHNNTDKPVEAGVSLVIAVEGGKGEAQRKVVEVAANSTAEVAFPFTVPEGTKVNAEVRLMEGDATLDAVAESVPIRPWGVEYVSVAGGVASGDAHAELRLPDHKYASKRMTITIAPSVESALVNAAEAAPMARGCDLIADVSSRGKELTALVEYLRDVKRGDTPEYQRLSQRLESEIARLLAMQREDGGWSWAGVGAASDPFITAEAVTTLVEARKLGFEVSTEKLSKAMTFLQSAFHRAEESDNERKAAIVYAQARGGAADFASANRLFRLRNSLDTRSLALVMLSLCEMDRAAMAAELISVLKERVVKDEAGLHLGEANGPSRWGGDPVETTALVLHALVQTEPKSEMVPDLARWLWAQRRGVSWGTPSSNTAAIRALAAYSRSLPTVADNYTLVVQVNGKELKPIKSGETSSTASLEIPRELLDTDKVRISFGFTGSGQYSYSCLLTGFSEEVVQKSEEQREFVVERDYLAPPATFNGRRLRSGFATVEIDETWDNHATEVTSGREIIVSASWRATDDFRSGGYVVVREPLPAGCRVVEGTVSGSFERFARQPGALLFFYRTDNRTWSNGNHRYELAGALPGNYRALPTHIWSYYQPEHFAFSDPGALKVLPRAQQSGDKYRMTPDELYYLGKALFDDKQYEEADRYLSDFHDNYKVRAEYAKDSARMLFTIALKKNDPKRVVRFFEILRERFPDYVVPFAEIVRVAKAYREVGEAERQVQVCRAVAESSFDAESRIAGVLNEQGEFEASVAFMRDLALSYPDLASTEQALYSLSQFLYGKASKVDEAMKKAGLTKEKLIERSIEQVRQFLTLYPSNPLAEEATIAMLNAYVNLERYEQAAALAAAAEKRYPQSAYLDDFQYVRAFASFLGEEFEEALALCRDLSTKDYPRPDRTTAPSDYKNLALYIAAQVFHAKGDAAEALKYYSEVKDKYPDAKASLDYFQHSGLKLPEVTLVSGDNPAEVKLTYRNLKQAEVKVFRVDLLKFYQSHRSLANIAKMNLAGIKPIFEQSVELQGGGEMRDRELAVKLPLDKPGAYFVVATASSAEQAAAASGVLLRTDLKVEVQEEAASGRVRVNVMNTATGQYIPKSEVWVIGSDTPEFRKGQTDLRGIMVAEDIRGRATVIAAKEMGANEGRQYAFYRGDTVLQPDQTNQAEARRLRGDAKKQLEFKDEATRQLRSMNEANQALRSGEFEQQLKGGAYGAIGGVQVQKAY